MSATYLRYLSDGAIKKLRDDVESWLKGATPAPEELRPGIVAMVASGLTKHDAESVLRDSGVLQDGWLLPATYWYAMRRRAENDSAPASHVIARRLMLEETSVGAIQRGRKLSRAFDAVAEAVLMGDYDRSATLIRLAEAIRQDEAAIVAMDAGEDVEAALERNGVPPDRVSNSFNISAIDELAHLIRGMDGETTD